MKITKPQDIKKMPANSRGSVVGMTGFRVESRNGHISYVYRRTVNGKTVDIRLQHKTFSAAKQEVAKYIALTKDEFAATVRGAEQEKFKDRRLEDVANSFIQWRIANGDWEHDGKQVTMSFGYLNNHILPVVKKMHLDEVTPTVVAKIAMRSKETPEASDRAIAFLKNVFDWAKARGWYKSDNPADKKGALRFLLPKSKNVNKHWGALPLKRVPEFCKTLKETGGTRELLFLFSILTATRSGTVRSVKWEDIDMEERVWHVEHATLKTKGNPIFNIPLSKAALAVLRVVGPKKSGYVFPAPTGTKYSDVVFCQLVEFMNSKAKEPWIDEAQSRLCGETIIATQHGIARACFKTWSLDDELGNDKLYLDKVSELCLHHIVKDAYNGAYERNEFFKRRVEMMEAWGKFCLKI